jgi:hypothetical protein
MLTRANVLVEDTNPFFGIEKFLALDVYVEQGLLCDMLGDCEDIKKMYNNKDYTIVDFNHSIRLLITKLVTLRCYLLAKGGDENTSGAIKNFIRCLTLMHYEQHYNRRPWTCPPEKIEDFLDNIWHTFKASELYGVDETPTRHSS